MTTEARLLTGDRVVIVAPAAQMKLGEWWRVAAAVDLMSSWGLEVELELDRSAWFYLAGPDEVRAERLNDVFADPGVRAVFCSRGGYGSVRLLGLVDFDLLQGNKMLVGFSDITTLHLAALCDRQSSGASKGRLGLVHGPNVATDQLLADTPSGEVNRQALKDCLFAPEAQSHPVRVLAPGYARGPLVGGCLSIVAAACGTRYEPSYEGAIVLLEDVSEPPYRIDRMLCQLEQSGVFAEAAGVVFGELTACSDDRNDVWEVVSELAARWEVPVVAGLEVGHGPINRAFRLEEWATLDTDRSTITL